MLDELKSAMATYQDQTNQTIEEENGDEDQTSIIQTEPSQSHAHQRSSHLLLVQERTRNDLRPNLSQVHFH